MADHGIEDGETLTIVVRLAKIRKPRARQAEFLHRSAISEALNPKAYT